MMIHLRGSLFLLCFIYFAHAYARASTSSPTRFLNFLVHNTHNTSNLPLSYRVPFGYFSTITPDHHNSAAQYVPLCEREVSPAELDAYTLQTEQFLTTFGINLYDAAVRQIALSILGRIDVAQQYEEETLIGGKTFQFASIRGTTECRGIEYFGQCTSDCGFCYGGNTATHSSSTLDDNHAYFFRLISDIWGFEGTVDARCPEKGYAWTWNDWRPVAGENAWANFLGPLQVAYIKAAGDVNAISDDSSAMRLAVSMFSTFQKMQMPNGVIAYAPYNTYDGVNPALGGTGSTENAVSALAGLRALLEIIEQKQSSQYKPLIPQLTTVMKGLTGYIKDSYSITNQYFRQGGSYDRDGKWTWNEDPATSFAVDCQTWVVSVIGAPMIDEWFGAGTTLAIWNTTKRLGGFGYNAHDGSVKGLGFSMNQQVKVISGEWTLGGVNMLRVLARQYPEHASALNAEADSIRQSTDDSLTSRDHVLQSDVMNYANKRYWIPWGWYANPIPSTASVGWAVMVDSHFNPFVLGGRYDY